MNIDGSDFNDHNPGVSAVDAHGHAALLLVESLIHGLCENATLSARAAAEIAERAVEVQLIRLDEMAGDKTVMRSSGILLASIAASLQIDNPD